LADFFNQHPADFHAFIGRFFGGLFLPAISCLPRVAGEDWDEWNEDKGFIPVMHWSAESALGMRGNMQLLQQEKINIYSFCNHDV
jgi:hypothetical protein